MTLRRTFATLSLKVILIGIIATMAVITMSVTAVQLWTGVERYGVARRTERLAQADRMLFLAYQVARTVRGDTVVGLNGTDPVIGGIFERIRNRRVQTMARLDETMTLLGSIDDPAVAAAASTLQSAHAAFNAFERRVDAALGVQKTARDPALRAGVVDAGKAMLDAYAAVGDLLEGLLQRQEPELLPDDRREAERVVVALQHR